MTDRCTDRAKRAEVYREAADLIPKDYASCFAVNKVVSGHHECGTSEARAYEELFAPYVKTFAWGEQWGEEPERTNCRILALCFMAAMVEAGDA